MFDIFNQRNLFERINTLIASENCTMEALVHTPHVTKAVLSHQGGVINFIETNFDELVTRALNVDQSITPEEQHYYDLVLRAYAERTSYNLMRNKSFVEQLLKLAADEQTNQFTLLTVAEVFTSVLKAQNDQVIYAVTEFDDFLPDLMTHINYTPVYDVIRTLSTFSSRAMTYYFDKIDITQILYDKLIETKNVKFGNILTNICSSLNTNNKCFTTICDTEKLNTLIKEATEADSPTYSNVCFKVLLALFSQIEFIDASFDDSYSTNDHLVNLEKFFIDNFEILVQFAINDKEFTINKGSAVQLIVRLIPFLEAVPPIADDMLSKFFKLTLDNPTKSMIHNSLLAVFEALSHHDEFDLETFEKNCNVKETIAKRFHRRHFDLANYWAQLHRIASAFNNRDENGNSLDSTETDVSEHSGSETDETTSEAESSGHVSEKESEKEEDSGNDEKCEEDKEKPAEEQVPPPVPVVNIPSKPESSSDDEEAHNFVREFSSSDEEESGESSDSLEGPPPIPHVPGDEDEQKPFLPPPPKNAFVFGPPPPIPMVPNFSPTGKSRLPPRPSSPPPFTEDELKDPWGCFIKGQFKTMSNIMVSEYGGKLPGGDSDLFFDLGSSDDE